VVAQLLAGEFLYLFFGAGERKKTLSCREPATVAAAPVLAIFGVMLLTEVLGVPLFIAL